jgi:hypothetical protein
MMAKQITAIFEKARAGFEILISCFVLVTPLLAGALLFCALRAGAQDETENASVAELAREFNVR